MKASDLYPDTGNTMKAADMIGTNRLVAIEGYDEITYTSPDKGPETKLTLKLNGQDKLLVLNKTNARTLIGLYGDECDEWTGKQFMLSTVPYNMNGQTVHGFMIQAKPDADFDDKIPW